MKTMKKQQKYLSHHQYLPKMLLLQSFSWCIISVNLRKSRVICNIFHIY